jgi:hypothetical protein
MHVNYAGHPGGRRTRTPAGDGRADTPAGGGHLGGRYATGLKGTGEPT